jgi:polyhydroxyalkanoate synthase
LTSAAAPTNFLASNPAAIKRAFDTGGVSLPGAPATSSPTCATTAGCRRWWNPDAFEVGRDLAVTPVPSSPATRREVLQYTPATEAVFERPVLVVPPPIGRFYFLDLRPGRSFVEYATSRGLQTFLLSWRNPTAEQGSWDLDTYAESGVGGHRHGP